VKQAVLAGERRPLWTDRRQRKEIPLVAREARQQPCAQERRLAGARGAEDHQQARRRGGFEAAQPVARLDDRRLAAEEDAGVDALERLQAAIGRALAIRLGRPGEEFRIEPSFLQAALQPPQALLGKDDVLFFMRAGR
jgi:hypothetical protein